MDKILYHRDKCTYFPRVASFLLPMSGPKIRRSQNLRQKRNIRAFA